MIRSLFVSMVAVASVGTLGASGASRQGAAAPGGSGPATAPPGTGVIGAGLHIRMSPARLDAAATRCAAWASRAGFADNGYVGGSLTTAVAVALAESGCNPAACYDDTAGRQCTPAGTRGSSHSIDRGVWQINSHAWRSVSNACAYRGPCNARAAYGKVSADGSYFGPWTVYLTDHYASYLWAAQQAVNALRGGTVTSAVPGICAAHAADRPGARVQVANCGSGAGGQQWRNSGGRLRTGRGLCLAATSARPGPVTVRRCTRSRLQDWEQRAGSTLFNAGARLCLTDPGSSRRPGTALTDRACTRRRNEAWFRP